MIKHEKQGIFSCITLEIELPYLALFTADRHLDSIHSHRELQKRHLQTAEEWDADIWDFGDFYDVMQAKRDIRGTYNDLMYEHKKSGYFNSVLDDGIAFIEPHKNWRMLARGNHEEAITKHDHLDLVDLTVARLNDRGHPIIAADYQGFIKLTSGKHSILIYYTHGTGGAAEVSAGANNTHRRQTNVIADIYISGHSHQPLYLPRGRDTMVDGTIKTTVAHHLVVPSYKQQDSWGAQKGFSSKPLGSGWLQLDEQMKPTIWLEID